MPKKALQPSLADQKAAPGGAAAVDRALSLLVAFRAGDTALSLTELAERTQLYKSTVLRLLASLEHAGFVQRRSDGHYALGPEVARLNAVYAASFSLESVVMPVLQSLVAATRESAAFHVRQGEQRLCLYRVDSPQVVRDHIKAGDLLPLDRGAGGRVLRAYAEGRERGDDERSLQIRRDQVAVTTGDRIPDLAGVSAPAFGAGGELVGAVTLTMPAQRLQATHAAAVQAAAHQVTRGLGGIYPPPDQ